MVVVALLKTFSLLRWLVKIGIKPYVVLPLNTYISRVLISKNLFFFHLFLLIIFCSLIIFYRSPLFFHFRIVHFSGESTSPMSQVTLFSHSLTFPPCPSLFLPWLHIFVEIVHGFLPCHQASFWFVISVISLCSPCRVKTLHPDKTIPGTSNLL